MCLADRHSSGDEALTCAAFLVIQALGNLQGLLESLGKGLRAGRNVGRTGTLGQLEDRDDQAARAEGTHVARALADVGLAARRPAPDRQFWLTGVAEVPDSTITMFVDDNIGSSSLLPSIHPSLYEYVPAECTFTTVDPAVANKVLRTDPEAIYSEWGSFEIREFAVSADCNLIIVTGDGLNA